MKSVMKIFGILACVMLICMSTASAKTILHNEAFTLHCGENKHIYLDEIIKHNNGYTGNTYMDVEGRFDEKNFGYQLKSKKIIIIPHVNNNDGKDIFIQAKKPGEGQIIVRTYKNPFFQYISCFLDPEEYFDIRINII